MSVRSTLGGVFAAASILIIGWQAGSAATSATTATSDGAATTGSGGTSGSGSSTAVSGGTSSSGTTGSSGTSGSSAADGTYTGDVESTRFGDVQVSVTISGGAITEVTALHLTDDDGRSVQISNRAAPVLRSEVLASQSADVSIVSGATYTSDAYLSSVQSALDQAGF